MSRQADIHLSRLFYNRMAGYSETDARQKASKTFLQQPISISTPKLQAMIALEDCGRRWF